MLIAGWLLGCAAQSAHAEERPVAGVVATTPVLGDAVETVHRHEPVRRVVRAVAAKTPEDVKTPEDEKATPDASPPPEVPDVREIAHKARHTARVPAVSATDPVPVAHERARAVSKVAQSAPAVGHVSQRVDRHQPFQAHDRPDGNSASGASSPHGSTAGFPNVVAWAPTLPRASDAHVFDGVPPAVRTAADEPSFAPD
ncbi:hypothetical protein [Spirillospora sp. NPDC048823]|uniref:hypothetical protein n=1 Tax=unclassified Spirillospora TaxID=2642701 RepID=UPI003720D294